MSRGCSKGLLAYRNYGGAKLNRSSKSRQPVKIPVGGGLFIHSGNPARRSHTFAVSSRSVRYLGLVSQGRQARRAASELISDLSLIVSARHALASSRSPLRPNAACSPLRHTSPARALGLGATLTALHLQFETETEEALGLPPDVHSYALLPIGYPIGRVGRAPLGDFVYANRWGEPYRDL